MGAAAAVDIERQEKEQGSEYRMMSDDKRKLEEKYKKDGRFKKEDSDRLSVKAVNQATGKEQHSEFSAGAMSYVVPGYLEQETQHKKDIGSKKKRLKGFWLAALAMVEADPDIKPKEAWERLPEFEHDQWQFEPDGNEMIQRYHGSNNEIRKSQDWKVIKFDAFRQTYIYKAKIELS